MTIFGAILFASFILTSCDNTNSTKSESKNEQQKSQSYSTQTDWGELPGGYKTMDQYYIDNNGNKVWHGVRKNIYPSGRTKMECFYVDGTLEGCVDYDEAGNVIKDTRK